MRRFEIIEMRKAVEYMNIIKFGAYISRLRKDRDMPQSELADMLNVTRQAVSKWERGEGFPDISILCSIAEVFGVSVDTLINSGATESPIEAAVLSSVAQNHEISEEALQSLKDGSAIQDILNIAPYLKVSTLSAIADKLAKHNIDISNIIELSEFMSDESVVKLFQNSNLDTLDDELLEKLIPFLDSKSVHAVFEKIMNGQNSDKLIQTLRPYIGHELIESAVLQGVLDYSVLQIQKIQKGAE